MRPLNRIKDKTSDFMKNFWDHAERNKLVEKTSEEQIFHLTSAEAKKCRYEIINMTTRMAECKIHKYHGVRLHPPHLWNIDKDGIVYQKINNEWIRWFPNIKENIQRLNETS